MLRATFRRSPGNAAPGAVSSRAVEFGWRVHSTQESWTDKADLKASILLALEGGGLYVGLAGLGSHETTRGWGFHLVWAAGTAALLIAILAATIAVFPRLGRVAEHRDRREQAIYFGKLRHWTAPDFRAFLSAADPESELDALSFQLVQMAKLNWVKHRWIQVSLLFALTGIVLTTVAEAVAP